MAQGRSSGKAAVRSFAFPYFHGSGASVPHRSSILNAASPLRPSRAPAMPGGEPDPPPGLGARVKRSRSAGVAPSTSTAP
eukprot:6745657-Alexandrium_andersonii.AAC.1